MYNFSMHSKTIMVIKKYIAITEVGTQSPAHALVLALALVSEDSPGGVDPRSFPWNLKN